MAVIFLFQAWSEQPENRAVYLGSLDSKTRTRLMTGESKALYVPPGFILFVRNRTLMARPFDADRRRFIGEAVPVAENVAYAHNANQPRLSADGKKVAFHDNAVNQQPDVWIYDIERDLRVHCRRRLRRQSPSSPTGPRRSNARESIQPHPLAKSICSNSRIDSSLLVVRPAFQATRELTFPPVPLEFVPIM
jgi:hypothetical protein